MFIANNALIYKDIKEYAPKALEKLEAWVRTGLEGFQRISITQLEIKDDVKIPEISNEHVSKATEVMLTSYFRTLYDFFDLNKIFLTIDYIFEEGFVVNVVGTEYLGQGSVTRIEAEIIGFKEAFRVMEEGL
jgi:hypothetical protein